MGDALKDIIPLLSIQTAEIVSHCRSLMTKTMSNPEAGIYKESQMDKNAWMEILKTFGMKESICTTVWSFNQDR